MTKFVLLMVFVIGYLSASSAQSEEIKLTLFNHGYSRGLEYSARLYIALTTGEDKWSKYIRFNESDSVTFNPNEFKRAAIHKIELDMIKPIDNVMESINVDPKKFKTGEVCAEVIGSVLEETVNKIPCP